MAAKKTSARVTGSDKVAAALLARILDGEWQVGDRIPSVDDLESTMPESRVTICKGIRKLCRQGYLHSAWRSGTFVSSDRLVRRILLHVGGDPEVVHVYPFTTVVTRKLEALLAEAGMQVEIHWEGRQRLLGSRLAADLEDDYFEGVISVQSNLPVMLRQDFPTVLGRLPIVHVGIHDLCPWVHVDMAAFNDEALAICRVAGARRLLYFCPADGSALATFAADAGMTVHRITDADGAFSIAPTEANSYALFLRAWERLRGRIDAVITPDDVMAKGIAQALLGLGADGAGVRIIALTNGDSGVFYPVPIDAIEVDCGEVAAQAMALLDAQFSGTLAADARGVSVAPVHTHRSTPALVH